MFYDKSNTILGYIVYSYYGLQSHVIMNENGVVFSCNPKINEHGRCVVFGDKTTAELAKDTFYDKVAAVILITKFESDKFVS